MNIKALKRTFLKFLVLELLSFGYDLYFQPCTFKICIMRELLILYTVTFMLKSFSLRLFTLFLIVILKRFSFIIIDYNK